MRARDIAQALVGIKALRIDAATINLQAAKEAATTEGLLSSETEDQIEARLIDALGELAQAQHEIHVLLSKLGG